jgi:hypothetical protein
VSSRVATLTLREKGHYLLFIVFSRIVKSLFTIHCGKTVVFGCFYFYDTLLITCMALFLLVL